MLSPFVSAQNVESAGRSDAASLNNPALSDGARQNALRARTQDGPAAVSAAPTETAAHGATDPGLFLTSLCLTKSHPLALNETANYKENINPLSDMKDDQEHEKTEQVADSCRTIIPVHLEDSNGVAQVISQTQQDDEDVERREAAVIGDDSALPVPAPVGEPLEPMTLRPVTSWRHSQYGLADEDDSDTEEEDDFTVESLNWVTQRMQPVKFWGARGQLSDYIFPVPGPVGQLLETVTLRPVSLWGDVTRGLADDDDSDTEEEHDFAFESLDWVTHPMGPVKFWGASGQLSDYIFPVPCSSDDDTAVEGIEALSIDEAAS